MYVVYTTSTPTSRYTQRTTTDYVVYANLAKFSSLLGFSPVFYACPLDEETLYARAPRTNARADDSNRPGARRSAHAPSFA